MTTLPRPQVASVVRVLWLALLLLLAAGCSSDRSPLTVGWLTDDSTASVPDSILAWVEQEPDITVLPVSLDDPRVRHVDVHWLAIPDSASWRVWITDSTRLVGAMRHIARDGGSLLLTGHAALLPHLTGWESAAPTVSNHRVLNGWYFDRKQGLQSLRGHPLLGNGLHRGAYLWSVDGVSTVPLVGYFGFGVRPVEGRVVAVGKRHGNLVPDDKLVIEHDLPGGGTALSIGGWVALGESNRYLANARRLVSNAVRTLAGSGPSIPPTYWPALTDTIGGFTPTSAPSLDPAPLRTPVRSASSLVLHDPAPGEAPFSLGGRRTLVMGTQQAGISEVWTFPMRLLRDYRAGLLLGSDIHWLDDLPCELTVRPEAIERRYTTPAGTLTETVFSSHDKPAVAIEYRWDSPVIARLALHHLSELRWMWPFDSDALGATQAVWRDDLLAYHLRDRSGTFHALYGANIAPADTFQEQSNLVMFDGEEFVYKGSTHNVAAVGRVFELTDAGLRYVIAGSAEGEAVALAAYRAMHEGPDREYNDHAAHVDSLLAHSVGIDSPDDRFDDWFRWGIAATDRFVIYTPGIGTGLMAGFGTRDKGWDGGHEISGRPSYAWYFGRDAAWTGLAMLGYGETASIRDQLRMFRDFQGVTGKIYHELTASGVRHDDAADATPLYIILAAAYLRHSGDLATIRELSGSLRAAFAHMRSTDRDGDGWIDNVHEGHGWVEGGALWGMQTSHYLAGMQARATADMAELSRALGDSVRAYELLDDAARLRARLAAEFESSGAEGLAFGLRADGSLENEPTVLPAPSVWLNEYPVDLVEPMLDRWASAAFTTDWGVRILGSDSERYRPTAYHAGSVWPLFTGWTALAEYAYGRPSVGFSHVLMTMHGKDSGSLGYVEEVLRGDRFDPEGICPHQAWSETAALHPILDGLIGWKPDALNQRATLAPQLPPEWDRLAVTHLRVGDTVLDVAFHRGGPTQRWTLTRRSGSPVTIDFAPGLLPSTRIERVRVNGEAISSPGERVRGRLHPPLELQVEDELVVEITTRGGISIVPVDPRPEPGQSSRSPRLIRQEWRDNGLHVIAEAPGGSTQRLRARVIGGRVSGIEGGRIVEELPGGYATFEIRFPAGEGYTRARFVVRGELRGR